METFLVAVFTEAIRAGALRGLTLVAAIGGAAWGYFKYMSLQRQKEKDAADIAMAKERFAEEVKRDTTAANQGAQLIQVIGELTRETAASRAAAAKDAAEQRQALAVLTERMENHTKVVVAAVAQEGNLTRDELQDRRLTDATKAADRAATAALAVSQAPAPFESDPPPPPPPPSAPPHEPRRRAASRPG